MLRTGSKNCRSFPAALTIPQRLAMKTITYGMSVLQPVKPRPARPSKKSPKNTPKSAIFPSLPQKNEPGMAGEFLLEGLPDFRAFSAFEAD
jgi:hypothetical protein